MLPPHYLATTSRYHDLTFPPRHVTWLRIAKARLMPTGPAPMMLTFCGVSAAAGAWTWPNKLPVVANASRTRFSCYSGIRRDSGKSARDSAGLGQKRTGFHGIGRKACRGRANPCACEFQRGRASTKFANASASAGRRSRDTCRAVKATRKCKIEGDEWISCKSLMRMERASRGKSKHASRKESIICNDFLLFRL